MTKKAATFRLSPEALEKLKQWSEDFGISQALIVELLIREKTNDPDLQIQVLQKQKEQKSS